MEFKFTEVLGLIKGKDKYIFYFQLVDYRIQIDYSVTYMFL